ncbi:DUF4132 domain-containing protein [Actinoplanes derwentensis]|uniref:DUF4132 domain-containing protein n=1 Tax=Actinoplanes derwentensis TaxID=113562 RepID=A0A1H2DB73_9ACTN|nr:DUF4132 domain-containing protein [Actinoplanes derwentensis]GID81748.1 hypothetical protein Ade03nite_06720 [Actinoplanes derwentensis]SDT79752.1 protein of unknown function [Actinoplanes derwentensis]
MTFVVPAGWKRFLLPRRGDAPAFPQVKLAEVTAADELLTAFDGDVRGALGHRLTPGDLSAAGHAHLSGEAPSPLGAAVVAAAVANVLQWPRQEELLAFTELWRSRHGLPFAAAAVAELTTIFHGSQRVDRPITRAVPDLDADGFATRVLLPMAFRLRRAVAAVPAGEYAQVVAALAAVRGPSLLQRVTVSVLTPDETGWATDITGALLAVSGRDGLKALMLTVVTDEAAAARLAAPLSPWQVLNWNEVVYTFTATLGPAAAPALAQWLDATTTAAQLRRRLLTLLTTIGGDAAFTALLVRLDQPDVAAAIADSAGRSPARALRLLAEAPVGDRLLRNHLANHRDLADEVRPLLTDEAAGRFDAAHAVLTAVGGDVAGPADLPPILVSPPWTDPVPRKPLVVTGLIGDDAPQVEWAPGERESWGDGSWPARHGGSRDWATIAADFGTSRANPWHETFFFLQGPDEVTLSRITGWRPEWTHYLDDWGPELLARYQADAVPALVAAAKRTPVAGAPVLLPAATAEVALLMAGWLAKSRAIRTTALAWFARHPAFAARALIPIAVGKVGKTRTEAEAALRVLPRDEVLTAAAGHGPEAVAAAEEILAVDPVTILPKVIPAVPDWANPAVLPPVRLTGGRGTLPADAVRHLLTMLALSRLDGVYPGLPLVAAECEPADLAEFAWVLFTEWREAGHPAKASWPLDALGLLGDDETVRRLAPVIRAWPGEGGHTRAVTGLDVLATIGTDVALMYLNGIAQKVKFKGLKERAEEKIAELAAGLGLTSEELADRLVPDLGLGETGSLTLDYGRRTFTVGFDEQLKPYVTDAGGKKLKALPKPGTQDDPVLAPEAYQRFTALKKDVRAIATDQVRRLERAMVDQRRWTGAGFRQFLAGHPLLRHLVRRLVWVRFDEAGRPAGGLRLAEDGSLADRTDETVTLPDDALIGIGHPLHLGDDLATWVELFADYEILQPFDQLGRGTEPLTPERAAGFTGRTVPSTTLLGLERRGWRRGSPQDGGVQGWFERDVPGARHLVVAIDPGIPVGAVDVLGDQTIEAIFVEPAAAYHWSRRDQDDHIRELDPITAAEALRELSEVLP